MKYVSEIVRIQKAGTYSVRNTNSVFKGGGWQMTQIVDQQIPFQEISAEARRYENLTVWVFIYITTDFNKLRYYPCF